MKLIDISTPQAMAKVLKISESRAVEAVLKAQLIFAILGEIKKQDLTHAEVAKKSKQPRSAVTGILSGSMQKVTIDRLLRIAEAVGLKVEWKIKKAG